MLSFPDPPICNYYLLPYMYPGDRPLIYTDVIGEDGFIGSMRDILIWDAIDNQPYADISRVIVNIKIYGGVGSIKVIYVLCMESDHTMPPKCFNPNQNVSSKINANNVLIIKLCCILYE